MRPKLISDSSPHHSGQSSPSTCSSGFEAHAAPGPLHLLFSPTWLLLIQSFTWLPPYHSALISSATSSAGFPAHPISCCPLSTPATLCHFTLFYLIGNIITVKFCYQVARLLSISHQQNGRSLKASSVLSIIVSLPPGTVAHEKDTTHICQVNHWLNDPSSASESLSPPLGTTVFLYQEAQPPESYEPKQSHSHTPTQYSSDSPW